MTFNILPFYTEQNDTEIGQDIILKNRIMIHIDFNFSFSY